MDRMLVQSLKLHEVWGLWVRGYRMLGLTYLYIGMGLFGLATEMNLEVLAVSECAWISLIGCWAEGDELKGNDRTVLCWWNMALTSLDRKTVD